MRSRVGQWHMRESEREQGRKCTASDGLDAQAGAASGVGFVIPAFYYLLFI